MKHASLFSGIGGFDLAAEWMGWNNTFHCEWNEFGQKILKYYWPEAVSYGDITKTDFTIWRDRIDILTGGFPCQPYSVAGKRKGKEDERHLWPEMLRAIREVRPRWVVGENVSGLVSWNGGMVFNEVQADLEAEGYEILPFLLPACGKNALHKRERVWFIAYANGSGNNTAGGAENSIWKQSNKVESGGRGPMQINGFSNEQFTTYPENTGQPTCFIGQGQEQLGRGNITMGARQWDGFPTISPICNGNDGLSSKLDGITFLKWRTESIKAGGNAIVPQVAHEIFKAIQAYETRLTITTI